uniref:RING-type domain-containing protein n=1 Tax=Amphora coffeiformis TaxID=265554 RepID=A0A7S3NZT8_9STRA
MSLVKKDIAFSTEETLKHSIRVRNLLARTLDDDSFHQALHSVICACIRRLDENSVALYSPTIRDTDTAQRLTRQQIQGHTIGSLAHATQRLRGGGTFPGDAAAWLYEASHELKQLQSSITRTVVIALMGTGIPRASKVSPCFPHILAFLDARYRNILENDKDVTEAAQKQLVSTSWVVVDLLAHHAGMKSFQDWERESYAAGIDHPPWNLTMESATENVARAVTQDGAGTLDLIMDIILFWPAKTQLPEQEDNSTGMSIEGLARMNHRCKEGAVWDEIYLRHIKYVFTKYALGGSDCKADGLFRWHKDRAILLAVLAATTNAMHGRLAFGFVADAVGPHAFDEARIAPTGISLTLAINLLNLVLGDEKASAIIEKYSGIRHLWEPLLGPRPTSSRYRRAPLPTDVSKRIVHFLQVNIDAESALDSLDKGGTDAIAVTLYLDLAAQTQDPMRPTIFWGIDLLQPFFRQLYSDTRISGDIRKVLCSKVLATAVSALEIVPPSKTPLVEEPHARDHDLPLGVPADFSDREDLNGLLHKHRLLQRKRALLSCEAMEARKGAYRMITDCVRLAGAPKEDPLSVPIAMFQCIASEERGLTPSVAHALKAIVTVFKDAIFSDVTGDEQNKLDFIAPLLPSLICAVVSDSADSRNVAEEWTRSILVDFDDKIAGLISNFLDADLCNSVPRYEPKPERQSDSLARFSDFGLPSVINEALYVILGRMKCVADCAAISPELALALLSKFDYSVEAAKDAFDKDKVNSIREVGMACRAGIHPKILQTGNTCRICFNDFGAGFALSCGHRFCTDCWKKYLSAKASEEGRKSIRITCPDHKCDEVISIFEVERIDPQAGKRLVHELVSAFVESDPLYSACPKVGCPMVAWQQTHRKWR